MLNFFRKKIIEGIIKGVINDLPKYKLNALAIWDEHKDEIFAKVKEAIKNVVVKFVEEKLK